MEQDVDMALGKDPAGQKVHLEDAAAEIWSNGHLVQNDEPSDEENVPGEHSRHISCVLFLKYPAWIRKSACS